MRLPVTAQHGLPRDMLAGFGRLLRNRPKHLPVQGKDGHGKFT